MVREIRGINTDRYTESDMEVNHDWSESEAQMSPPPPRRRKKRRVVDAELDEDLEVQEDLVLLNPRGDVRMRKRPRADLFSGYPVRRGARRGGAGPGSHPLNRPVIEEIDDDGAMGHESDSDSKTMSAGSVRGSVSPEREVSPRVSPVPVIPEEDGGRDIVDVLLDLWTVGGSASG